MHGWYPHRGAESDRGANCHRAGVRSRVQCKAGKNYELEARKLLVCSATNVLDGLLCALLVIISSRDNCIRPLQG